MTNQTPAQQVRDSYMTSDETHWHQKYENLSEFKKGLIDEAFQAATDVFKSAGLPVAMDDRAEKLIAVLAWYQHVSESTTFF